MENQEFPKTDQGLPILSLSQALKNLSPNENYISAYGKYLRIGIFRKSEDIYLIILGQVTGEALGVQLWPVFDAEVNTFNVWCRLRGGDNRIIRLFKDKHLSVSVESDFSEMLDSLTKNRPNLQLKDRESYSNNISYIPYLFQDRQYAQNQPIKVESITQASKEIQWNILLGDANQRNCILLEYSRTPGLFMGYHTYIKLGFTNLGKIDQYSHISHGKYLFGVRNYGRINFENFLKLYDHSSALSYIEYDKMNTSK